MNNIYYQLPVYQKAKSIQEITEALVNSFDENNFGSKKKICYKMIAQSKKLVSKIAEAEGGDIYSLRIENAFQVRGAARELKSMLYMCSIMQLAHEDYTNFLAEEIDSFRILFLDWVASFDKHNDIYDEWHFKI